MSEHCKLLYAWDSISEMSLFDPLQCDHKKFTKICQIDSTLWWCTALYSVAD